MNQVLGIDFKLESTDAGTDVDDVKQLAGLVDEGGEGLLHADGRATATDIAREGQQLLHRDEVAVLVASDFGGLFQIDFLVPRDDAHEVSSFVAFQHQRLEYLIDVLTELVGDMLCAKVVFIHLVRDQLILDLFLVEQSAGVGFVDFLFRPCFSL